MKESEERHCADYRKEERIRRAAEHFNRAECGGGIALWKLHCTSATQEKHWGASNIPRILKAAVLRV
ncbi:hypothetical protein XELAEV_18005002mg [Xenopus laevis]|uniref:Uncharacterized protein n=1 Tax=Xenopus laevis TaxID=8355 RepID=A0A974I2Q9_XENLA|nr:hypothetical protein XELAEV_18005002mg [Xenopus laevis]